MRAASMLAALGAIVVGGPPPVGSIPTYMGTLVTSKATKSGSVIAGNTVEIVVVRTNPGYAPNPSAHGTGVIVAKYC